MGKKEAKNNESIQNIIVGVTLLKIFILYISFPKSLLNFKKVYCVEFKQYIKKNHTVSSQVFQF